MSYDETVYTLTVSVTDDGNGQLTAAVSGDSATGADLDFANRYQAAPAVVRFRGTKTLRGRALENAEFRFTLTGSDGTAVTVANDEAGRILFPEIAYSAAGTYTYTVAEAPTAEAGMIFDSRVYTFTVTVTDDGSGQLAAAVSGADILALDFENIFSTGALVIRKTVTGDPGDRTQAFAFTVTFQAEGEYPYSGSRTGTLHSGQSISLRHGEYIEITGLPAGTTYSVTESRAPGYFARA